MMTITVGRQETTQPTAILRGFELITGEGKVPLFVLNRLADRSSSMKILDDAELRSLTHQEALLFLANDKKLTGSLKVKWFYLEEGSINKNHEFLCMVDEKGELAKRTDNVSPESVVCIWNNNPFTEEITRVSRSPEWANMLSLSVYSDSCVAQFGGRFGLLANDPSDGAPVVVGVPKDWKLELKSEPVDLLRQD
jgi:hypothetical protein